MSADAPPSPSLASLLRALLGATTFAAALLVLVVLPAEYGIDVTGFGHSIGLTALSPTPRPTSPDAPSAAPDELPGDVRRPPDEAPGTGAAESADAERNDEAVVEIAPGRGREYKFVVRAGADLTYSWTAEGGVPEYDFHGEPEGAAKDVFQSYCESAGSSGRGRLTAPFTGTHGWYWRNPGRTPIRITLTTSGRYVVGGLR